MDITDTGPAPDDVVIVQQDAEGSTVAPAGPDYIWRGPC